MRRRSQAAASTAAAGTAAAAAASQLPPPRVAPQQPWRKVLWARQEGYDDYHTGESFLEDLVVNATVPHRDYRTVVWSALVVDQQLATVAAVGSASHHLYKAREAGRVSMGGFEVSKNFEGLPCECVMASWHAGRAAWREPATCIPAFGRLLAD